MAARVPADSSRAIMPCGVCETVPPYGNDKFCRSCGNQLALECLECSATLRIQDRWCPACGHRRIFALDLFRYGLRLRTSGVVIGTLFIASSAWLLLRYVLRNKL